MGRPTKRKSGVPYTEAERAKRYRKRKGKAARLLEGAPARRRREASRNAPPLPGGAEFRIGDCREVLADIADNSVALVLTDPPYGVKAEPLYRWLAEFAARVLVPGGSLICYTGHLCLPRDIAILDRHLDWQCFCTMKHTRSQKLFGAGAMTSNKPVLWFAKGRSRHQTLMPTEFVSPRPEKLTHPWGQGDGGVWVPIEHLTEPGELIVDPYCGTGEWGRIAAEMGRRWIGSDIAELGKEMIMAA
jgi:hypothetical protein